MNTTRITKLIAACGALAMMTGLASCGSSDKSADKENSTISFQTKNLESVYKDYFNGLIAKFEKQNPGIKVKWIDQPGDGYANKLSTDAAANQLPDVMDMMPKDAYILAKSGAIDNISKANPDIEKEYTKGTWKSVTFKGFGDDGAYAYPWYLTLGPTFYNKKILTECGMDTAKLPDSWESYFEASHQMAATCKGKYQWSAALPTIGTFGEYGAEIMNKDQTKFTFNSPKGVELVQHYVDMYKDGMMSKEAVAASGSQTTDLFKQGSVATRSGFMYDLKDFKQNAPEIYKNLAVAPAITRGHQSLNAEVLAVSSQSKHKDAAHKFAAFVTNNTNQVDFAKSSQTFPSTAKGVDDPYFRKDDGSLESKTLVMLAANIKNGEVMDPPQFIQSDLDELGEQLQQAVIGQISAKQALDTAVKDANDRLAQ
ncbi:sugar ABC transporter substrate-binding protein [Bifidobacterium sp. W8116]|uniref:Sugar ABC transporter substrate-binding protein n=1 Tax=Bifidobacterium choladohabitans TaxID=2750947 RepID=A0ABS0QZB8_9BIFI|nr:sugar ABC transporter substrate-binding protein [Bifidobacterium choladohabitans]MBI0143775.1 sugar ABC transporter substrate-binding protein [Bifidobacterium choladohabitans]